MRVVAAKTGTFYGQAMTVGDIYTIVGDGTAGYSGDLGPAAQAELDNPEGVAVDDAGNLLIADASNARVRMVAETSGTFYGRAMRPDPCGERLTPGALAKLSPARRVPGRRARPVPGR